MYIGSCRGCKQYCQESKKQIYDDNHLLQKHVVVDSRTFRDDNNQILRKSKKAWESYDRKLSNFFKNLRFQINEIEKAAYSKLEDEEIKTAINSNDKFMVKVAKDIFAEKYKFLMCDEIDEFNELISVHDTKNFVIKTDRQEDVLVDNLLKDIDAAVRQCSEVIKRRVKDNEEVISKGKTNKKEDRIQETKKEEKREVRKEQKPASKKEGQKAKEARKEEKQKAAPSKKQQPKSTKTAQKSMLKLQIIDLTVKEDDFSIDVKLINQIKRLGEKEVWRVNDETGEIKLIIPPHEILKPGLTITLQHCYTKLFAESLQLHTKSNYTIRATIKGESVVLDSKDIVKRKKANDGEQKQKTTSGVIKINEIDPEKQNLVLVVQVLKPEVIDGVTYCILGDDTGIANAKFNVESPLLKQGHTIYIRTLDPVVNSKGNIVLESTKRVIIEAARSNIRKVNEKNNISLRIYEQVEDL